MLGDAGDGVEELERGLSTDDLSSTMVGQIVLVGVKHEMSYHRKMLPRFCARRVRRVVQAAGAMPVCHWQ